MNSRFKLIRFLFILLDFILFFLFYFYSPLFPLTPTTSLSREENKYYTNKKFRHLTALLPRFEIMYDRKNLEQVRATVTLNIIFGVLPSLYSV